MRIETEVIIEDLPIGFDVLRAEARAEGFARSKGLRTNWHAGTVRFERDGEALLAVRVNGTGDVGRPHAGSDDLTKLDKRQSLGTRLLDRWSDALAWAQAKAYSAAAWGM